ncbi:hypothetical protein BV898_06420 [Hypsibius exemplaris]|uniref:Cell wall hydrolase SleB domain-containing protein n=1 Tax=Hypsibius exemplaris TaxID=2072580 RepID=A0A1W0WWT3_HYPEX|nr:hypothetical protein BV898_06420 [Hypsibius exemplaris]
MAPDPKPGSNAFEVLQKTIYGEARGESKAGQVAVAWVIKNRVDQNKSYWGGDSYEGVCMHPRQFECWNKGDIAVKELDAFNQIGAWLPTVFKDHPDLTKKADHFHNPGTDTQNNPATGGKPNWLANVEKTVEIGDHRFYRTKFEFR